MVSHGIVFCPTERERFIRFICSGPDSGAPLVLSDNIHCASPVLMDWKTTDWKITGNLETYYFPCDETLGIMASSSTSPATSSSH